MNHLDQIDKLRAIAAASLRGKFASWRPQYESLLGELRRADLALVRKRCRESHVNSPVIASLVAEIESGVIGTGIQVQFKHKVKRHQQTANRLWDEWTQKKNFSSDGELNFKQMQGLVAQELAVVGETFVKKNLEDVGSSNLASMIPISYQLMPPDQLYDQVDFGAKLVETPDEYQDLKFIKGIGYNKRGRKKAYIFYEDDYEGDSTFSYTYLARAQKKVLSAEEVHHVYNRKEIRYRRGWPLIGTAVAYAHLLKLLDEAQLSKQVVAAMFAAFIHDNSGELSIENASRESEGEAQADDFDYEAEIQSGTMYKLPTGKDIKFADAPEARDYKDFDMAMLRKIAGTVGVSYEALASNHSDANYSAARQSSLNAGRRLYKFRENVLIDQFVHPTAEDFKSYLNSMAILPTEGLTYEIYRPGKIIIDPAKEVIPKIKEIRAGLKSWSGVVRETGQNPEELIQQIADDQKALDKLGLRLDTDSRDTLEDQGTDENTPAQN